MVSIQGTISLPGDKSISHRAALFSSFMPYNARFTNFNHNEDCNATLDCLKAMGIEWQTNGRELIVQGIHPLDWKPSPDALDARNSGTTARLISGILASLKFSSQLTGDASLSKRPMGRVIEPLHLMGARIASQNNHLPLIFHPVSDLTGIRYQLPVASAQVKSALLLAGLFSEGQTEVIESIPTRDHTERLLKLDVISNKDGSRSIFSSGNVVFDDISMEIPGDFSSAAFFISAALMLPGSELLINNVSLNPTRTAFLGVLRNMGAQIDVQVIRQNPEPMGHLFIKHNPLHNTTISADIVPNIIDEIPILSILATQCSGLLELHGARELRFKESDRIRAVVSNLTRLGIQIHEFDDGFALEGPQEFRGGTIETFDDHRIAMSFAIANLLAKREIILDNADCVAVSFPSFFELLSKITMNK
jgi:3-phosphoshikimate 1-carboxyvinyltransferase